MIRAVTLRLTFIGRINKYKRGKKREGIKTHHKEPTARDKPTSRKKYGGTMRSEKGEEENLTKKSQRNYLQFFQKSTGAGNSPGLQRLHELQ